MDNHECEKEIMKKIYAEVMEEERQRKLEKPIPECNEPECNEPEWNANPEKCAGCISRTYYFDNMKFTYGCRHCDANWDCPDLIRYD